MPSIFPDITAPNKTALRQILRQRRQSLAPDARRIATQTINRTLKPVIKRGKKIAVYHPYGSELRLDDFVRCARQRGAALYLPYIEPSSLRLWFTPYPVSGSLKHRQSRGKPLKKGFNIPQFHGKKIRAHQLNTLIVPLVGIDRRGYRLGQGGGYYDCTLAHCRYRLRPRVIAAAFNCQTLAQVPYETHDVPIKEWFGEQGRVCLPVQAA